jgi:hypothetical protein
MFGARIQGASQIYPYDGRHERDGKKIWKDGFYQTVRNRYLEAFKVAAAGLRGPNPASLDTEQWWSLGRHFDLVTPLLDWTHSPYIAAFFPLWEVFSDALQPSGAIFWSGCSALIGSMPLPISPQ